jgi:hypothetical protein
MFQDLIDSEELVPDLSVTEAAAIHQIMKTAVNAQQILVYIMWRRNGWKKMGAESFEQYVEHCDIARATAYRWIERVKQSMIVFGWKLSDINFSALSVSHSETNEIEKVNSVSKFRIVSNRSAQALAILKTHEGKAEAWRQYQATCPTLNNDNYIEKIAKEVALAYNPKTDTEPAAPKQKQIAAPKSAPKSKAPTAQTENKEPEQKQAEVKQEESKPEETPAVTHSPDTEPEKPADPVKLPRITVEMVSIGVKGEEGDFTFLVRAILPNGQPVSIVLDTECLPGELMELGYRKWDSARKKYGATDVRRKTFVTWKEDAE